MYFDRLIEFSDACRFPGTLRLCGSEECEDLGIPGFWDFVSGVDAVGLRPACARTAPFQHHGQNSDWSRLSANLRGTAAAACRRMKLSDKLSAPSWVVIQLLEQCNLRCRMCYEWGESGAYHTHEKHVALELSTVLRTVEECRPWKPVFEFF